MRDHYDHLLPKMGISTRRRSFVAADDPDLRITFDADVRWTRNGEPMASTGHALFPNGERILEVKCARAYPRWLVNVLNACGIRPQSMSKYGRAYEAYMASACDLPRAAVRLRIAS